jgi:hypothetical protein
MMLLFMALVLVMGTVASAAGPFDWDRYQPSTLGADNIPSARRPASGIARLGSCAADIACRSNDRFRRVLSVTAYSGDRLLSEPIAGTPPCRREPLFVPHSGHTTRRRGLAESGWKTGDSFSLSWQGRRIGRDHGSAFPRCECSRCRRRRSCAMLQTTAIYSPAGNDMRQAVVTEGCND